MATNKIKKSNLSKRQQELILREKTVKSQINKYKKSVKKLAQFNIGDAVYSDTTLKLMKQGISNKKVYINIIKNLQKEISKSKGYRIYESGVKFTPTKVINQYGVEISKDDYINARKNVIRGNKMRQRQFNKYSPDDYYNYFGQNTGATKRQVMTMGDEKFSRFSPRTFDFNTLRTQERADKRIKHYKDSATKNYFVKGDKQMVTNYKRALIDTFGNKASYKLRKEINNLSTEQFLKIFYSEANASFTYIYNFSEAQRKLEFLNELFGVK